MLTLVLTLVVCAESLRISLPGVNEMAPPVQVESGDSLLKQAQALGNSPKYHEWVDATLKHAGMSTKHKSEWHSPGFGTYFQGEQKCPGFPTNETKEWTKAARQMQTPTEFHKRCHHKFYAFAWDGAREASMKLLTGDPVRLLPDQTFFDVGCGSMRLGIPLIRYLDKGNYHGLDVDDISLRAGIQYEIPMAGLMGKDPKILKTDNFEMSKIAAPNSIDVISEFSVLKRKAFVNKFFQEAAKVLKPDGHVVLIQNDFDCVDYARIQESDKFDIGEMNEDSQEFICSVKKWMAEVAPTHGFEKVFTEKTHIGTRKYARVVFKRQKQP